MRRLFSMTHRYSSEIAQAKAAVKGKPENLAAFSLHFGPPKHGWIDWKLSTSGHELFEWSLSDVSDPFRPDAIWDIASGGTSLFILWLEALATKPPSALVLEMEGPVGVLHVSDDEEPTHIRIVISDNIDGVILHGRMHRQRFLADFYDAIVAYWESDALRENWKHWGMSSTSPPTPWDLRSTVIESAISSERA
jgi:hypothetical protein